MPTRADGAGVDTERVSEGFFADPVTGGDALKLAGVQAVIEIDIDGATLTARCDHPRGSFENPLSRAQIESKFRTYADGVLAPSAIAGTVDAVGDLENLGSVRKLMDMLRPAIANERL